MRHVHSLLFLLSPLAAAPVRSQDTAQVAPTCEGKRITGIEVRRPDRTAVDRVRPAFLRPLVRAAIQTAPTRPSALRPWVLLDSGDTCSEARRRESERLLRNLPYVANATVTPVDEGDGVRLVVEAHDDIKPVLGLSLDGATPEFLRIGTVSLGGSGTFLAGDWTDGGAYRDAFGLHTSSWSVFGSRTITSVDVTRNSLGRLLRAEVSKPFLTRFQTTAWTLSVRDENDFVRLERNVREPSAWPTRWRTWSGGALSRLQRGDVQVMAGGIVTHERITPDADGVVVGSDGLRPVESPELVQRYAAQEGSRASAVVAVRALRFLPVAGLENLEGVHDVARGAQLALALGRGISGDHDGPHLAAELYSGVGTANSFASLRGTLEQRDEEGAPASRLLSGRIAWYWHASKRQTQELSAEYVGIWRDDIPVALFLDDRRSGPRGFKGSTLSGSRLLVVRLERRLRIGGFGQAVGLGLAGFADAAKLWAGDAPLGTSPNPRLSIGSGLLFAIPRNSRKTIRLDAALPVAAGEGASGVTVRIGVMNAGRAHWREPASFLRARILPSLRTLVGWF